MLGKRPTLTGGEATRGRWHQAGGVGRWVSSLCPSTLQASDPLGSGAGVTGARIAEPGGRGVS